MISFLKFLLTGVGLTLILMGVGAILLVTQVQKYATRSIEQALADVYGAKVQVETISVLPLKRRIELRGFRLANPSGFKEGIAVEIDSINLDFDWWSVAKRLPVVREMVLKGTDIHYVYKLGKGTNIRVLAEEAETNASVSSGPRLVVEKLVCRDARVHFSTNLTPNKDIDLTMVNVEVSNLEDRNALSPGKIVSIFLRSIIKETLTLKGLLNPLIDKIRGKNKGEPKQRSRARRTC